MNGKEPNITDFLVGDLTAHLFSFDISVEPKMIELTFAEKNSQTFLIISHSLLSRCFYRLNRKQQKLLVGYALFQSGDLNKHVSFNLDEQQMHLSADL